MVDQWFAASKDGLAKLLERRGRHFAVLELIQNAWDQRVTDVVVELGPGGIRGYYCLRVADNDPHGFEDLAHAYTLFAETSKRRNPEQRGRFNIGEKLVLACCREARVSTTTGTVIFDDRGRHRSRRRREAGSEFVGLIRMTRAEYNQTVRTIDSLLPPEHVTTGFNGRVLEHRAPLRTLSEILPTEVADENGFLRRTTRKTRIEIHRPRPNESGTLYEMGIPVVETGDGFHVNIGQKVPLNTDRDNVTPGFLTQIRVLVLNAAHDLLGSEEATADWVRAAASDERCGDVAIRTVLGHRFGKDRVSFDPSDPEAGNRATAEGFAVIKGGMLSAGEWENARRAEAVPPAGRLFPSRPKFDGICLPTPWEDLTKGMRHIAAYAAMLAEKLMGVELNVVFLDCPPGQLAAAYERRGPTSARLVFYIKKLGRRWFDLENDEVDELLLHEFAHHFESNHLDERYHDAICRLGSRLKRLALAEPESFTSEAAEERARIKCPCLRTPASDA